MAIHSKPPRYRAYVLTLWEERNRDSDTPAVWRFRLEDPRTGQQRGFASLEALTEALKREMDDNEDESSTKLQLT